MTAIQQAKANLEVYVSQVVLKAEDFDATKFRYLEQRLVDAALDLNARAPF